MLTSSRSKTTATTLLFRRIVAYFIDIFILFACIILLNGLLWIATSGNLHSNIATWWQLQLIILATTFLPAWFYFSFGESTFRQATIGKIACKIRVSQLDNTHITLQQALLRNLLKLLPWQLLHLSMFIPTTTGFASTYSVQNAFSPLMFILLAFSYILMFIYLLLPLFTHGKRSIHDYLTHTHVH